MNRVELKEKAKQSLQGKYKETILMFLIFFGVNFAAGFGIGFLGALLNLSENTINLFADVASIVLSGLLTFGYMSYFLKLSRDEEVTKDELFAKTDLLVPYIVLSVLIALFTSLWTLLLIIPGIIAAINYSQAYYIVLDNPELKPMEAISKSKEMMNGHKMDYFILNLSFLGWIIAGIFTLGILYFWLIPYMNVTNANFYNYLKEQA